MLERILGWSLRHRWTVLIALAVGTVFGALAIRGLDVDAFPDTTPVQVQVNAVAPALAPEQVGDQFARRGRMHRPISDKEGAGSSIKERAAEAGSRFGASGGVKASGRTAHRQ